MTSLGVARDGAEPAPNAGVVADVGDATVGDATVGDAAVGDAPVGDAAVGEAGRLGGSAAARGAVAPVAGVVGACAALVTAVQPIGDNSVLTHLATGRLLIADGLPSQNPFLYSSTAFPVPSWVWSGALAAAEQLGGVTGIRMLVALVAALLGALLVALCAPADRRGGVIEVLVPSGLAALSVVEFLGPRPHLVSFVLLAAALLVWSRRWSPWWLAPLFALWINVHGSWVYGLAVLGLVVVARAVDERRVTRDDLWPLPVALLGTVVGAALYPDRFELLLLPMRQFGDPVEREALQAYNEWARPGLGTATLWPMLLLGVLALWSAWRGRRWGSLGAAVLLVAVGMSGLRMIPIAAISLVPFAATALRGVGSIPLPSGAAAKRTWLAAGVLAVFALVSAAGVFDPPAPVAGYDLAMFDTEAYDRLDDAGLIGDDVRVLTILGGGNYLAWRFGERANAFVDDRPGAAELIDYRRMLRGEGGWVDAFERADPDVVLWPTDSDLVVELARRGWTEAGEYGPRSLWCSPELAERC